MSFHDVVSSIKLACCNVPSQLKHILILPFFFTLLFRETTNLGTRSPRCHFLEIMCIGTVSKPQKSLYRLHFRGSLLFVFSTMVGQVWRVDGEGKTLLTGSDESKFYSGDCYIFQYSYPGETGEEYLVGTWFGDQSVEVITAFSNILVFFEFPGIYYAWITFKLKFHSKVEIWKRRLLV